MTRFTKVKISQKLDREMEWFLFEAPIEIPLVPVLVRDHRGVWIRRFLSDAEYDEYWKHWAHSLEISEPFDLFIHLQNGLERGSKEISPKEE